MANKHDRLKYKGNLGLLRRVFGYFKAYKARIAFAVLSMIVVAACTAAEAYLVKPALDDIFINKDRQALMYIPMIIVGVIFCKGFFRYWQNYLMNTCGLRVLETLRNELFFKMVRLPVRFFEQSQVGMLMSRIMNDVLVIRQSLPAGVMMTREALTILALIGVVFWQDPYLACFAVLVLPLAIYPFVHYGKKLRKLGRRNQAKLSDVASLLQEIFSGIRVVKAFANETREAVKFRKENDRLVTILVKQVLNSELSSRFMEMVGAVGVGAVVFYGGHKVIDGQSTPGQFFSFLAALIMLYDPIKKMNSSNLTIQQALAGAERVFHILDAPDIRTEESGSKEFNGPLESLELRGVTFTYPGTEVPALDNVTLAVDSGERVAVVGPSGAGKTTLVNLLPLFYRPDRGEIRLNGLPLEKYTLDSLRMNMGMVSQDTFLFNATVGENIAYGRDKLVQEEIEQAARAAYAHDFIRDFPEGYDTVVGERGVKISGGQKQRLTIARALLKNPPLLILDEATSALDTESERIVQKALDNLMKDRTSIVIAHRLSTVLGADKIVVMAQGRVVAQGRHKELLKSCPLYARLYEMQFSDNQEG